MQAEARDGETIAVIPETIAEQVLIESFCNGAHLVIEPPAPFEANLFKIVIRKGNPPKRRGK